MPGTYHRDSHHSPTQFWETDGPECHDLATAFEQLLGKPISEQVNTLASYGILYINYADDTPIMVVGMTNESESSEPYMSLPGYDLLDTLVEHEEETLFPQTSELQEGKIPYRIVSINDKMMKLLFIYRPTFNSLVKFTRDFNDMKHVISYLKTTGRQR
ncbi:MAG: hypothetical protein UT34_C0001G0195 [candidate division WS6 bacterium GW2011_GWF2_39_15]|uniref:Uncharacterized protein n=1 Tax=candidate division WS6 bacterium GW2011_GWF2_39_15 TaxID=1619100 RepID=A0A0G0Q6X0_9BACT|nr:MAG: hypothetical protein UT34_C0001G0195 [candidate division WS6 bacterium GW2011_GWF2_39_15]